MRTSLRRLRYRVKIADFMIAHEPHATIPRSPSLTLLSHRRLKETGGPRRIGGRKAAFGIAVLS